ncbi:type II secretion protein F [Spongiactinospora rosea]|uniref:Type II secretion protein F n=1 Tax=Spongiactinospora rosea TaxID=2248750 RepID=A0A366LLD2_9ACTN|nr:type II secretion system F family protein [Spongiactinospora rosea]RBQ13972.1 type II secretion protein F [Spongiactinospora rosea]
MTGLVLGGGAALGLGAFLMVAAFLPAPPALGPAMERLRPGAGGTSRERLSARARLAGSLIGARVPRADLAMIGKTADDYLVKKGLVIALGAAGPLLLWAWCGVLGIALPWPITWGTCAAFAVAVFFAPDFSIRKDAADARKAFRQAIVAYLDLVALARAAGSGPAEALEASAKIGDGWTFQRLAIALDPTRRGAGSAWDELARLAREINVPELGDLASIAAIAGTRGAGILDTLMAKAQSLREVELSREIAKAKSRTETMTVPMALSVVGFLLLLGYPAFARMAGG